MLVEIRGAGDIATGIALRLHRAGMQVVMCDLPVPTSIRRTVCFSEAVRLGETEVEGVRGVLCADAASARAAARAGDVAVIVDPEAASTAELAPDVLVDAILAKRNLGTRRDMAPVVIGVGPGFTAREDCDAAVETMRGHYLGRVYYEGSPIPNTAVPGLIGGYAGERVMRAPADGAFEPCVEIGSEVRAGDVCARVAGEPMRATIDGVVRGLLQAGVAVTAGMKCGDVDPRCHPEYIRTVSDKASAVGGGVLEAICALTCVAQGAGATEGAPLSDEIGRQTVQSRCAARCVEKDAPVPDGSGAQTVQSRCAARCAEMGAPLPDETGRQTVQSRCAGPRREAAVNGSLSDPAFVSALLAELSAGRDVALASLLSTRGSMPRHEGARLAVLADGRAMGTVGGGAIELTAIDRARAALAGRLPADERLVWDTREETEMACGGDALLAVRTLGPADAPALDALLRALESGEQRMVEEDWSDPAAPALVVAQPARSAHVGWDERRAAFRELVHAPEVLHLFGAGHVASALVPAAASAGFEVRVYDDRPELARPELIPEASRVTCGDFEELARGARIGARDYVAVMTHGHLFDETVLRIVLERPEEPAFVGCIGSRRKSQLAREHLVAAGVDPDRVARVRMPIGLAIGAVTPAELALAVASQLVLARARLRGEGPGKGERV